MILEQYYMTCYKLLAMYMTTKNINKICTKISRMAMKGLALRSSLITLEILFGLDLLKRAAVSGLEWCLRSRGMCFRISRWSTGIPSRFKNDLIPIRVYQVLTVSCVKQLNGCKPSPKKCAKLFEMQSYINA